MCCSDPDWCAQTYRKVLAGARYRWHHDSQIHSQGLATHTFQILESRAQHATRNCKDVTTIHAANGVMLQSGDGAGLQPFDNPVTVHVLVNRQKLRILHLGSSPTRKEMHRSSLVHVIRFVEHLQLKVSQSCFVPKNHVVCLFSCGPELYFHFSFPFLLTPGFPSYSMRFHTCVRSPCRGRGCSLMCWGEWSSCAPQMHVSESFGDDFASVYARIGL